MREKITKHLLSLVGAVLMLAGCVGMWTRYPLIAVGVLLIGVSLQPALYTLLPLKRKAWRFILPVFCFLWIGAYILWLPQKSPVVTEFIGRNDPPAFVYISKSGERYHYTQSCAGDGVRRARFAYAEEQNLKPCQNCTAK